MEKALPVEIFSIFTLRLSYGSFENSTALKELINWQLKIVRLELLRFINYYLILNVNLNFNRP